MSLDAVVVTCDGTVVADHRRCLASHQVILHPGHARVLRAMPAESLVADALVETVEERDLSVYDRAVGIG